MAKAHVMMVPYPAQGHVIPLLELAHILATHDIRITFVNTEFIHHRLVKSSSGEDDDGDDGRIRFVSVPDGLESWERDIPGKLIETVWRDMPRKIEELVRDQLHHQEGEKVTCLVCDHNFGTIQQVAKNMGIQSAVFSPTPAAVLVSAFNVPKLIEDEIIDNEGTPLHDNAFQFAPTMPIMTASDFVWHRVRPEISEVRRLIFNIMRENNRCIESADWVLCNSAYDLEPGAFTLAPRIVPIGPLLPSNGQGNSAGHLWKHDSSSLEWLDQQPPCSVIFVAFGSTTIFNKTQFQELALGLERTNRPFLWAVRPDRTGNLEFPEGFLERVSGRGRITGWVPQQEVLSHPSIACFVCHAGWNSTVECLSNGVPILCWPYSADNFISRSYICDIWRVGLPFELDHGGESSQEFKKKIDLLLNNVVFKERALELKEMMGSSTREGGSSYNNLSNFISWIQESDFYVSRTMPWISHSNSLLHFVSSRGFFHNFVSCFKPIM